MVFFIRCVSEYPDPSNTRTASVQPWLLTKRKAFHIQHLFSRVDFLIRNHAPVTNDLSKKSMKKENARKLVVVRERIIEKGNKCEIP